MPPQMTRRFSVSLQLATLAGFYLVFATFVLLMVLQPGNQAEGRQLLQTLERPEVSLARDFTRPSVDEGETVRVKVKLDRALLGKGDVAEGQPHDEADKTSATYPDGKPICHRGVEGPRDDESPCIEGGIVVWDSYDDSAQGDSADELVAFVFRKPFEDDDADTPENNGDVGLPISSPDRDVGYRFSASHPDLPEVSIASITPAVGEEGSYLRVTLRLSRALTADEKFCYPGNTANEEPNDEKCIQGGIIAWDSYNDHLQDGNSGNADSLVKFVFGEGSRDGVPQEDGSILKRWTVSISNDNCITPDRTIRIAVNTVFDDADTYGYLIDGTVHTVPIAGNDEENGVLVADGGDCLPVDDGVTEDITVNRAPAFSSRPITLSVPENTEAGEDIGSPVTATDEENDDLTYSLTGADANHFDIDSSNGQIETDGALDHETKSTYHLAVSVTDNKDIYGDPDSAEDDSIDVTINVDDVNEPPMFDSTAPITLNVVENIAANENIGQPITATDPDVGDTLIYVLDTGDGASFDIDTTNGQIMTKDALDREIKSSYTVTVSVTDGNDATGATDPAIDDTHTLTITVGNEVEPPTFDEEPPQGQNSLARSVAENTPAGSPIGNPVSATSEDGATLTYSLTGTDAASFEIDSNGQIKTKAELDFETKQTYDVTVSVTDGQDAMGNTETTATEDDSIDVTINVTDVNEPPAFDANAPTALNIVENTIAGTDIGSPVTAIDPDVGDTLTYSLDDGDGAAFDIDMTNGQIKTKGALDREDKGSYTVTVSVTDGKDAAGSADPAIDDTHPLTINVTDVNEPPAFDANAPTALNIVENTIQAGHRHR